jgi:hypothetical protein
VRTGGDLQASCGSPPVRPTEASFHARPSRFVGSVVVVVATGEGDLGRARKKASVRELRRAAVLLRDDVINLERN